MVRQLKLETPRYRELRRSRDISGGRREALISLDVFHAVILQRPRGQQCRSDDEVIARAKEAASGPAPAALRRMVNALVADASADEDEETAPLREVVRDSGADERRALYAARAGEAGAGLRRLQPAVAVDPGKAASKLKYAETQYEANKQFAPGLLRPVKGVKACKPKDASIDKVFCNPPRLRAPGILGGTMEDWSVIFKCGAQDGIRGICKAIWCGTMTDGVKGIICDVRACAFYKDPLCTEGPTGCTRAHPRGVPKGLGPFC